MGGIVSGGDPFVAVREFVGLVLPVATFCPMFRNGISYYLSRSFRVYNERDPEVSEDDPHYPPTFSKLAAIGTAVLMSALSLAAVKAKRQYIAYPGYVAEYKYTIENTANVFYQMPINEGPAPVWGQWTQNPLRVRFSGGYAPWAHARIRVDMRFTKYFNYPTVGNELPVLFNSNVRVQTNVAAARTADNGIDGEPAVNTTFSTSEADQQVRLFEAKDVIEATLYLEGQSHAQGFPGQVLVDFDFETDFINRGVRINRDAPMYNKEVTGDLLEFVIWGSPAGEGGTSDPIFTPIGNTKWHLVNPPAHPYPFPYLREIQKVALAGGRLGGETEVKIGLKLRNLDTAPTNAPLEYWEFGFDLIPEAWLMDANPPERYKFTSSTAPTVTLERIVPSPVLTWALPSIYTFGNLPIGRLRPIRIEDQGSTEQSRVFDLSYKWNDGITAKAKLKLIYGYEAQDVIFTHGATSIDWTSLEVVPLQGEPWSTSAIGASVKIGPDYDTFTIANKALAVVGVYAPVLGFIAALGDFTENNLSSANNGTGSVTPIEPVRGPGGLSISPNWRVHVESQFDIPPTGELFNGEWQIKVPQTTYIAGYLVRVYNIYGFVRTEESRITRKIPFWEQDPSRQVSFWQGRNFGGQK